jgi:hypothetical protein
MNRRVTSLIIVVVVVVDVEDDGGDSKLSGRHRGNSSANVARHCNSNAGSESV